VDTGRNGWGGGFSLGNSIRLSRDVTARPGDLDLAAAGYCIFARV
jgi:hypothetical protein